MKQKHSFAARAEVSMLLGLMIMPSIALAQGDTWTEKVPLPTARTILSTSAVNGKIYAIGGAGGSSAVEEYDPATDTWTTKAPMPTARQWLSTSAVNGKIYVIGGDATSGAPGLATIEEYDPAMDTWTKKADMPTARFGLSTSVVDGKIYAIGGFVRPGSGRTAVVEAYDPAANTWTRKADMPTPRFAHSTSVVDGKIFAIGGALSAGGAGLRTVEMYDPVTDTWITKASMPTRRTTFLAASAVHGIIYVIGGISGQTAFSTVEAYDPATDSWTGRASMPTARGFLGTSVVNGKIYAIGGQRSGHGAGISTVEEYTPPLASIQYIDFNSSYIRIGIDSLTINCKIFNPHGFDLQTNATIQNVDSTFFENRSLYDDGLHEDGQANDGLWGTHLEPLSIESEFLVNVTASDADSVEKILDSALERFTTIGPVVFDGYTFVGSDVVPNPGDNLVMKLMLRNEGMMATASNVTAELTALDTLSSVTVQINPSYGNIPAKENAVTAGFYRLNIDENATPGAGMHFRVDIAGDGYPFWTDTFRIDILTSVADPTGETNNPTEFVLHQNYPNPFNPGTKISYELPHSGRIVLKVFTILGQKVRTLVDEFKPAGSFEVLWDGRDNTGQLMPSGVYLYRIEGQGLVLIRKMVLLE